MRIEYSAILAALEKEAIKQTKQRLIKDGFEVSENQRFEELFLDLFATRGNERRIYEFKIRGNGLRDSTSSSYKRKYEKLQRAADAMNAKLMFVFITPPADGASVSIDGFEERLFNDLFNKSSALLPDRISPTIQCLSSVKFDYLILNEGSTVVVGQALASVESTTVSEEEFDKDPTLSKIIDETYSLKFEIRLDANLEIQDPNYELKLID